MIKIIVSIYIDNKDHETIDYRFPEKGNPGIGGTQYMSWTLAHYMSKYTNIKVHLMSHTIDNMTKSITVHKVNTIEEAAIKAKEIDSDVFLFRSVENSTLMKKIDELKLKSIAWGHNFGSETELSLLAKCNYIKRYICVSKTQLDTLIDHKIYSKSDYIYNAIDVDIYKHIEEKNEKEKNIVYIGSLIPSKGVHILTDIWPKILKNYPDAKLHIIGSGQLYKRSQELGESGIAESKYEKRILKNIMTNDTNLRNSVKFHGIKNGKEKIRIMKNATIGIVNPTGKTETFGIGAIEFQILQVPVITKAKDGFFCTVQNDKSGYLVKTKRGLENKIKYLLENDEISKKMGEKGVKFVTENFEIKKIVYQWENMILQVVNEKEVEFNINYSNMKIFNSFTGLKILNFKLKQLLNMPELPSILAYQNFIKKNILKIIRR